MSTPTVSRQISSSSASVRPVLEKNTRPPSASSVMRRFSPCSPPCPEEREARLEGWAARAWPFETPPSAAPLGEDQRYPWAARSDRRPSLLRELAFVVLVV